MSVASPELSWCWPLTGLWRRLWNRQSPESASRAKLGQLAERLAEKHIRRRGGKIVQRNWRHSLGEIDLIVVDRDELVFVEVKSKSDDETGRPIEQVNAAKRRRIERLALAFCSKKRVDPPVIRFDVVEVFWSQAPEVVWTRGAWLAGE